MYTLDVSVILVNYNTTNLLLQAIRSVHEKSEGFTYEIIVVDNNSADSPKQALVDAFGDKVIYIALPENIGFGRANNEGIKIAKGRNLFLLNTDTYLINNAISILNEYIDSQPKVGSCGGNLYTKDLKHTYSFHSIPYGIRTFEFSMITLGLSRHLTRYRCYNVSNKPISVGNVSGANMMLRHDVIKEVGAFDPIFFMYCEETELSWRIKKAGYKNMNVPEAKIVHLEGQSSTVKEAKKLMEFDGRAKYYKKTRGTLYLKIANILLLIGTNMRLIQCRIFGDKVQTESYRMLRDCTLKAYFNKE